MRAPCIAKIMFSSLMGASLFLCASARAESSCFVAFVGEPPALASSEELPKGRKVLAANSKEWMANGGARVEIGALAAASSSRPVIAYAHRLEAISARNAKGGQIQVPVIATGHMAFELVPGAPLLASDPDGNPIAWILCSPPH